ncbi:calcium-binding protein [Hankyongella ginsenosidimutans]|uniref:calcium-binding protein n=1 Tax=Hankyongella ginsenosidimutans TaxID=1763828 RepID=UPI001FEC4289|nr:calcium-binding protein [Hankyongella ginsenosidimutans]
MSGVNVSLETGVGANADAAGDSYAEIEDITGSSYGDLLEGDNGNNVIHGGAGGDILYGGGGTDTLFGDAGNDFLFGGDGQDSLYGDDGDDRLFGEGESDTLFGGNGNDVLEAGDAGDTLDGGTGNDILIGGQGGDGYMIYRTSGNDTIYNYDTDSGRDTIIYDSATINYLDLWFEKVGKDLVVSVLDRSASRTDATTTIKDWFTTTTPGDYAAADNFMSMHWSTGVVLPSNS